MQASLEFEGVATHLVRFDPTQPSNRNFVLWFGQDRTILVRHELFDYHWPDLSPARSPAGCTSARSARTPRSTTNRSCRWLDSQPAVRFAFQPGTFQIARGPRPWRTCTGGPKC